MTKISEWVSERISELEKETDSITCEFLEQNIKSEMLRHIILADPIDLEDLRKAARLVLKINLMSFRWRK